MAITYPYIGTNPQPVIPAGKTPQQRHQSAMSLGLVSPFPTADLMPKSPIARSSYEAPRMQYEPNSSFLAPIMAGIQSRTAEPTATSQTRFSGQVAPASYMSPALSSMASQQVTPPSGLNQLRAAQLRMPARGTPADAGLRAAASTGLQLSGYQDRPMTLGQGLGAMLGAYTEAEQAAAQRQSEADIQQREMEQQAFANTIELMKLDAQGIKTQREFEQQQAKSEEERVKDVAKYTNELADDFRAENKEFTSAFTSFRKIAMTDPDDATGADDIALIFNYMKVLDPNSVVRESEFGLAAQSGSFGQTIMAAYQQIQSGQKLTPTQRRYFMDSAQAQFAPYVELRNRTETRYGQRADQLGVNKANVFDTVVGSESYVPRIVTTLEEGEALPSGTYFTVRGSGETRRVE